MKFSILCSLMLLSASCAFSSHRRIEAKMGRPATIAAAQASLALKESGSGPIEFERIVAASWAVDRSGLLNLEHPKAKHIKDTLESIEIYTYRITHPRYGTFLIDTGISEELASDGDSDAIGWMVAKSMNIDKLKTNISTAKILERIPGRLQGVFLTHLHLDHILGMPDIGNQVPVYIGPGDISNSAFLHLFVQGSADRLLAGKAALREWRFDREHDAIDVFGDGSLWVLHMPGHSPGSVAFLIHSKEGPVLITGDTCHTGFGWANGVEPGSYTADHKRNRESLRILRTIATKYPEVQVHLGHQRFGQKLSPYGDNE